MIPNCSLNNAKNLKLLLYSYMFIYGGCNPATYTGLILSHYKDPIMNQPGKWHVARVLVMAHMDLPRSTPRIQMEFSTTRAVPLYLLTAP